MRLLCCPLAVHANSEPAHLPGNKPHSVRPPWCLPVSSCLLWWGISALVAARPLMPAEVLTDG